MRRIIRYAVWLLFVGATAFVSLAPSGYVIDVPGPAFNVLGKVDHKSVLIVHNAKTYKTTGSLYALTVSQIGNPEQPVSLLQTWLASLDPSQELVPMDVAFPPNVEVDQIYAEDTAMMVGSQQDAQAAALNYLGIEYGKRVIVSSMMKNSAAIGKLAPGDFIDSVNGEKITDIDQLGVAIQNYDGTPIRVGITRDDKASVVQVSPKKVDGRFYLGVYVDFKYDFPFRIAVDLGDVGGPSAGTMFALGMIDNLTPGALVGDRSVAGTGTIDELGEVGPIGGIVQKLYSAKNAGATVFLAPAENCAETVGKVPSGLSVYRISKLSDAVELLTAMNNGTSLAKFPTCDK